MALTAKCMRKPIKMHFRRQHIFYTRNEVPFLPKLLFGVKTGKIGSVGHCTGHKTKGQIKLATLTFLFPLAFTSPRVCERIPTHRNSNLPLVWWVQVSWILTLCQGLRVGWGESFKNMCYLDQINGLRFFCFTAFKVNFLCRIYSGEIKIYSI